MRASTSDRLVVMADHLGPHAGGLESLWEAVPAAFLAAFGREVNKADDHDLMLCHAALAYFQVRDEASASSRPGGV